MFSPQLAWVSPRVLLISRNFKGGTVFCYVTERYFDFMLQENKEFSNQINQ